MNARKPVSVLFSGYAPVHYLCFRPVHEVLRDDPQLDIHLSGGFRRKGQDGLVSYALDGFYEPFGVDPGRVLPVEEVRGRHFDVVVCSHLSDALFPETWGKTVQLFHGVSFKNYAVREKALRFDLLCLPGRYHLEKFRDKGLIREGATEAFLTGFSKDDPLVDGSLDRSATLRALGLDPTRPTLLYAPTGDRHNSLETVGMEVIGALSADTSWNLLVKPHDHPKGRTNWFNRLRKFESESTRIVRALDVVPLLNAADLLISDASSVITEYTLLDRPIVMLDVPLLLKRVVTRGGALDLETYGHRLGPVVNDPGSVADVVRAQLADSTRFSPVRRAMAEHVFHDPGGASARTAEIIRYAAGLAPRPSTYVPPVETFVTTDPTVRAGFSVTTDPAGQAASSGPNGGQHTHGR